MAEAAYRILIPTTQKKEFQYMTLRPVLLALARNRNKIPLPKSASGPGIPLPPEQDTLISPNYQLALARRQVNSVVEETEEEDEAKKKQCRESKCLTRTKA
ncbi:Transcription initiation factor TFIID subunit 9 [Nymphaea thermarum]|nr:Transcription initiation factor TFIID subunit 9 [Nymphaea thermarum]